MILKVLILPNHQYHHEDADGFSSRIVGILSRFDKAVCPWKFNWIL